MKSPLLQIVPRAPGSREGVGDYARILAERLRENHRCETIFVTAAEMAREDWQPPAASAILLHYVNYGYDPRGVPSWLLKKLEQIPSCRRGKSITIFHELYATSSWRRSAFWLQPFQKKIARAIAQRSAICIVSSAVLAEQLKQLSPPSQVLVRPVMSTFGEPHLSAAQLSERDPNRWVICGGTELVLRSFQSFRGSGELFVIGGREQPEIRERLDEAHYLPEVEPEKASELLATCAFGWLDYFRTPAVPTAAVLKSTSFAAYCAHGVIPVFPAVGSAIALENDELPGPFCLTNLPSKKERPAIAQATYDWYGRNAASAQLAATVAEALER